MSDFSAYIGRSETDEDIVWPCFLPRMAATLGRAHVPEILPPLWHWMLFQRWVAGSELGPDGHPRRGAFLPDPEGLPRRMWAGSRVAHLRQLRPGDTVRRCSTITAIEERTGRSGKLLFVTIEHEIFGPHELAIREFQDIVYRGPGGALQQAGTSSLPAEPPQRTVIPDEVMLFRYSALTGNGHRIHYDRAFATEAESYPGLVVHGPLIATLLMEMVARPAEQIRIRAVRPAFCGVALHLFADGGNLRVTNDRGETCMSIETRKEELLF